MAAIEAGVEKRCVDAEGGGFPGGITWIASEYEEDIWEIEVVGLRWWLSRERNRDASQGQPATQSAAGASIFVPMTEAIAYVSSIVGSEHASSEIRGAIATGQLRYRSILEKSPGEWPGEEVDRKQLAALWPKTHQNRPDKEPLSGMRTPPLKGSARAEFYCVEWLRREIGVLIAAERPVPTKNEWLAEAKANTQFTGLSDRGFVRCWMKVGEEYPQIVHAGRRKSARKS